MTNYHFTLLFIFLSTLSLRRATRPRRLKSRRCVFLSTLSLRRATVTVLGIQHKVGISIHALLAESDVGREPTAGRNDKFLSTLSLRRATFKPPIKTHRQKHFYPRSPCGERRRRAANCYLDKLISIHALLAESDYRISARYTNKVISIHALLAESDGQCLAHYIANNISIHALLAESDQISRSGCTVRYHFYPRSPCGERPTVHQ